MDTWSQNGQNGWDKKSDLIVTCELSHWFVSLMSCAARLAFAVWDVFEWLRDFTTAASGPRALGPKGLFLAVARMRIWASEIGAVQPIQDNLAGSAALSFVGMTAWWFRGMFTNTCCFPSMNWHWVRWSHHVSRSPNADLIFQLRFCGNMEILPTSSDVHSSTDGCSFHVCWFFPCRSCESRW